MEISEADVPSISLDEVERPKIKVNEKTLIEESERSSNWYFKLSARAGEEISKRSEKFEKGVGLVGGEVFTGLQKASG